TFVLLVSSFHDLRDSEEDPECAYLVHEESLPQAQPISLRL
ncbi:hypothetical protein CDAR_496421, partial [Caerostris darwini]